MPLYYQVVPGATQKTNNVAHTLNDCFFVAPGPARTMWLKAIYLAGRDALGTDSSGIIFRLQKFTTTAAHGGIAIVPTPCDDGYQAASHTAGYSVGVVTGGTGGPLLMLAIGTSNMTPGNWVAPSLDEAYCLEAGATQSLNIFNLSNDTNNLFELSVGTVE